MRRVAHGVNLPAYANATPTSKLLGSATEMEQFPIRPRVVTGYVSQSTAGKGPVKFGEFAKNAKHGKNTPIPFQ